MHQQSRVIARHACHSTKGPPYHRVADDTATEKEENFLWWWEKRVEFVPFSPWLLVGAGVRETLKRLWPIKNPVGVFSRGTQKIDKAMPLVVISFVALTNCSTSAVIRTGMTARPILAFHFFPQHNSIISLQSSSQDVGNRNKYSPQLLEPSHFIFRRLTCGQENHSFKTATWVLPERRRLLLREQIKNSFSFIKQLFVQKQLFVLQSLYSCFSTSCR